MSTYHVVSIDGDGKARLVMWRRGQSPRGLGFTVWKALANPDHRDGKLDARQAAAAVKWVKKKGNHPRLVRHGFPFLQKDEGVVFPGDRALLVKLNRIGRDLKRIVFIKSGYRNHYQQWVLRMRYLRGEGNLAAPCCLKYGPVQHSWEACGKQSQSNHSYPPKGRAVDCGILLGSGYTSIGNVPAARKLMEKYGLCLPVQNPYEPWHVTVGPWVGPK